jgi:hypothetical protein
VQAANEWDHSAVSVAVELLEEDLAVPAQELMRALLEPKRQRNDVAQVERLVVLGLAAAKACDRQ